MGTVNSARAVYGLTAAGTPVGTNIDGVVTIGVGQTQVSFTDADIAYSFKVEGTTGLDIATLTLQTGGVVASAGSPTITDGGVDFEGDTLPTTAKVQAILFQMPATSSGNTQVTMTSIRAASTVLLLNPGDSILFLIPDETVLVSDTIAYDLDAGEIVETTVIASTT